MHSPLTLGFVETHPRDAARVLEPLPQAQVSAFLDTLPAALIAPVLERMAALNAALCLEDIDDDTAAEVLQVLPGDSAALLLRRTDRRARTRLLAALPRHVAEPLRRVLIYPEGTVGAAMDAHVLTLRVDAKVGEALAQARKASDKHLLHYIYVLDERRRLLGVVDIRELLVAASGQSVSALTQVEPQTLSVRMSMRNIDRHPGWSAREVLPVTDRTGAFQGALRHIAVENEVRRREAHTPESLGLGQTFIALADLVWTGWSALLAVQGPSRRDRSAGYGG